MTTWQNPTAGSCLIVVHATASGITAETDFSIEVFDDGSGDGAANVVATFFQAPSIQLSLLGLSCEVLPSSDNASCATPVRAPQLVEFLVTASSPPTAASLTLSVNCGGDVHTLNNDASHLHGNWLPPVSGGVCILTARAVNSLGGVGLLSAAILALPGTAASPPPR